MSEVDKQAALQDRIDDCFDFAFKTELRKKAVRQAFKNAAEWKFYKPPLEMLDPEYTGQDPLKQKIEQSFGEFCEEIRKEFATYLSGPECLSITAKNETGESSHGQEAEARG